MKIFFLVFVVVIITFFALEKTTRAKAWDAIFSPSSVPAPVDNDPNLRILNQVLDLQ